MIVGMKIIPLKKARLISADQLNLLASMYQVVKCGGSDVLKVTK